LRLVEFRLLGPLEAVEDGRPLALGGRQQRAVLAIMLLHANELVPAERLIDVVWGERPPPTAATTVQVYVSRLRKLLGRELLVTRPSGYILRVPPEQIDVRRAERLIAAAHETAEPVRRSALLRDALALWRGSALADFAYDDFARADAERLEDLRLATLESAVEAELELGRHAELVPELEALLEEHPLRERLRELLMLALYRAGRHADALSVYRDGRRRLVEELGLEPGPALQQLERQILAHDPVLEPARTPDRRVAAREERKILSALFAEVTALAGDAETADPEAARRLLEPHFVRVGEELERFGGSVQRLLGDAVLAVFGAPAAHEDDAERAVRAGLAVRDLVAGQREGPRVALRVGISTGEALVPAGPPNRWGSSAFGSVFGVADRIRASAPANTVIVTEPTYRATREAISYRRVGSLAAWEALSAKAPIRAGRPGTSEVALVGRAEEIGRVAEAVRAAAETNTAQLVTVVGAPGIGKTRLLRELAARPEARAALWLQGRSIPYGDGVAYWAFAEAVKSYAGILDTDSPAEAAEKIERAAGAGPQAVANQLRVLLALEAGEVAKERSAAFAAWHGFLEAIAAEHPVVLALEDVHWADEGLLDFVEHVATWSERSPLVLLCTARPELLDRRPEWAAGVPHAATVDLSPLPDGEMRTLVAALLERDELAAELTDQVVARVGGNPLFADEYVRTLVAGGLPEGRLPDTVHHVIAARLDALPADAKALLQDAAVIGKVFWAGSAAAIGGRTRVGCEAQLDQLVHGEFVQREERSAMQDEAQYSFKHVLIRDVAYGQIPRGDCSQKHRRAAQWIQSHARADDVAELMAHHYASALELARNAGLDTADLVEPAIDSLWRAGERARQLYANEDAAAYFRRALALLQEAPDGAGWRTELSLRLQESLGEVHELTGNHAAGENAFGAALALAPEEERLRRARLLRKQALSRQLQRKVDEAREAFDAADDALGDEARGADWWQERCEITIQRLQLLYFGAPLEEFAAEAQRVRPLIEARGTPAQRSWVFNWLGAAAMRRDRFVTGAEALAHARAGLAAACEGDSIGALVWAHFVYGFCLLWGRQFDEAEAQLRESLVLAERIGDATNRVRCLNYLAVVERWRGNVETARELAQLTLDAAERGELLEYVFQARATLAWVAWRTCDHERADELARSVVPRWDEMFQQRVFLWMPLGPLIGVALGRGAEGEAIEHARAILEPTRQPLAAEVEAAFADAVAAWDGGDRQAARRALDEAAGAAAGYGYL
jgi:predicted ATPase/DNA-binding SARP family transcriptional activator